MKSSFFGGAYKLDLVPLAAQTCVNLFLEPNESQEGDPAGFIGTPGLLRKATLSGGAHRAAHVAGGYEWRVVGANVYRIASDYTATLIGTLPNSTGAVRMADNGLQLGIAHPGGWHVVTLATSVMAAAPDSPTMSDITFIDNYGVGANANGTYSWSNLADFSQVGALSFASAEGHPDKIVRTLMDHRELLLFGTNSIEVVATNGDPELPFTRTRFIEQGIIGPGTAAKEDNSVFFVGRNDRGQGVVYRLAGDTPQRISTLAIEQAIARGDIENATAYTYQQGGHHFYVLCLSDQTWAFDINTGLWHQRAYLDPLTGELHAHRGVAHAFFNGRHTLGDREDGRLYELDPDTFTDDGDPILRERTWRETPDENRQLIINRAELIADMGIGLDGAASADGLDPQAWLSWSYDEARTWSSELQRSLGKIGEYRRRAVWWRLGASRRRDWRLRSTAPVRHCWRGFNFIPEATSA